MIPKYNHRALKASRPEEAACSDCEHIQDVCEPPRGAPSPLDIAPAGETTFAMGQCAMGIIVKKNFSKRENQISTSERSSSLHSRMSRTRSPSRPVTLKVSLTDDPFIIPRFGWLSYNLLVFQSSWIRDGFPRKNCCSFGFCPNYTSPTLPTISTTCATFFRRWSKFKIWKLLYITIYHIVHYIYN